MRDKCCFIYPDTFKTLAFGHRLDAIFRCKTAMTAPSTSETAPRRWFALIGIDVYMPGTDRHDKNGIPISFPSLKGCVRDVLNVKGFIETQFAADYPRITTLTSAGNENAADKPTYGNIVGLLRKITLEARAGDLVHIHYSGHGAQVLETYRGETKLYKAIVPLDIACGGQYLLCAELAQLFDTMVNKLLVVTVVLDCCHSGGAARNSSDDLLEFRGIGQIDVTAIAQIDASEVDAPRGTAPQFLHDWSTVAESHEPNAERGCRVKRRKARGYELLAACHPEEKAFERYYESGWQGVLTYNLLNSLKTGVSVTHGMLYRRLVALVNGCSNNQTPVFKGDCQRYFFSSKRIDDASVSQITVKRLHKELYPVLDVGAMHGMLIGWELAIYPWNASDFSDSSHCPKVHVTEVWPAESRTAVIGRPNGALRIEPGSQAILSKPLGVELKVKFSGYSNGTERAKFAQLRTEISSRNAQQLLTRLASSIKVISDSDGIADYHIKVENDHYKLLNNVNQSIGHFPSPTDPVLFLRKLEHLAMFDM